MHGTLPSRRIRNGPSSTDDEACRVAIRKGSKSFHAASLLLPREVRRSALALYAFCRLSDDMVDGEVAMDGAPASAPVMGATRHLSARLDRVYAGDPADHPADRAFADAVARHAIPRELPDALIEGFEWDESGRRYATIEDLHGYGARVAASVGAMMTLAMGRRDPTVLARACDLGLAMQLTNIARDVGEDARAGRLYLPETWLREAGLDPDGFLGDPRHCARVAGVVERLLAEAQRLYARSRSGIGALPPSCRTAIMAALSIYRDIGREIARAGHDSVSRRAHTSRNRKLVLAAASGRASLLRGRIDRTPAEPAVRHLIEAVERTPPSPPRAPEAGLGRMVMLLGSMEGREGVSLSARPQRAPR